MNEVGLNANWLGGDMTDVRTQEFTKEVLNHMRNKLSDYQEEYGTSIIWKQHRRNRRRIVWQTRPGKMAGYQDCGK